MGDLTGLRIDLTYDGLIKTNDEQPLDITAKRLQDGVGNNLPVAVSTSGMDYFGTQDFTNATVVGITGGTGTTNNVTKFTAPNVIGDSILVDNGTSVTNFGAGNIPNNTAFGKDALISNTTGVNNTAFGENALTANTTGFNNTVFGSNNLVANTTGVVNTVVGTYALQANITGSYNDAFGDGALYSQISGQANCAIGHYNLFNLDGGIGNTAIGASAGQNLTSGDFNTAVGRRAMSMGTNGAANSNTCIGAESRHSGFSGSVILGRLATATANNQFVVGSASTNAGTVVTETNESTKVWNVKINGVDYKILLA